MSLSVLHETRGREPTAMSAARNTVLGRDVDRKGPGAHSWPTDAGENKENGSIQAHFELRERPSGGAPVTVTAAIW